MHIALTLAAEAAEAGETPVGCVVTDKAGRIIGRGRNRREEKRSVCAHAELEAMEEACRARGDWRLSECSLYVTLEPCPMCAGAMINARMGRVFYGARDENTGSCGSVINLFMERYGHEPEIVGGICADESAALLSGFFRKLRED